MNELLNTIPKKIIKRNLVYRLVMRYDINDMWHVGYYSKDLRNYLTTDEYITGYSSQLELALLELVAVLKRNDLI
jgi:hypothetical protein